MQSKERCAQSCGGDTRSCKWNAGVTFYDDWLSAHLPVQAWLQVFLQEHHQHAARTWAGEGGQV